MNLQVGGAGEGRCYRVVQSWLFLVAPFLLKSSPDLLTLLTKFHELLSTETPVDWATLRNPSFHGLSLTFVYV